MGCDLEGLVCDLWLLNVGLRGRLWHHLLAISGRKWLGISFMDLVL